MCTCPVQNATGISLEAKPIIYLDVDVRSQHLTQKLSVQRPALGGALRVFAPTVSSMGGDEPHKSLWHPAS